MADDLITLKDLEALEAKSSGTKSWDDMRQDLDKALAKPVAIDKDVEMRGMRVVNTVEAAAGVAPEVPADTVATRAQRGDFTPRVEAMSADQKRAQAEEQIAAQIDESIRSGKFDSFNPDEARAALDVPAAIPVAQAAAEKNAWQPDAAWEATRQQELQRLQREIAEGLASGRDVSELQERYKATMDPSYADKPLEHVWYDPVDLVVDTLTFGAGQVLRQATGRAAQLTAKALAKGTSTDVVTGMLAGGIMTGADAAGSGPVLTAISGVIGTAGTASVMTMTRRGLAEWLKRLSQSNKQAYDTIMSEVARGGDKVSVAFREAAENNFAAATGKLEFVNSPLNKLAQAADAKEDKGLLDAVVKAINNGTLEPGTPVGTASRDASGAGDMLEVVGILPGKLSADTNTGMAREMHQANLLNAYAGPRVLWDNVSKAQEGVVDNLRSMSIFNGKWEMGNSDIGWERGRNTVGAWITSPSTILSKKSKDLVANPTFLDQQAAKIAKAFDKSMRGILGGLKKGERKRLGALLDQVNQTGVSPKPTKGGFMLGENFVPASEKMMDSFYATRILLDNAFHLTNNAAVRQARKSGVKWDVQSRRPVRVKNGTAYGTRDVNGQEWTADLRKRGAKWIEDVETREGRIVLEENLSQRVTEIPDNAALVKYEQDYIPIIYKDDWRVLEVRVHKNGKVESNPVATAPTEKASRSTIAKYRARAAKQGSDPDVAVHYMSMRKGDELTSSLFEADLIDPLHQLTPAQLHQLERSLERSGVDPNAVKDLADNVRQFSYKKNSHMMERGSGRLRDEAGRGVAPMEPSFNAIGQYLQRTASYASKAEYNAYLRDKFLNTYSELLHDPHNYLSAIKKVDLAGRPFRPGLVKEAQEIQDQIRTVVGARTISDIQQEAAIAGAADRLRSRGYDKIANLIDKVPTTSRFASIAKGVAATAKLGMFNFSQLVVQSTAVLNTIGKFALRDIGSTALEGRNPAIQGGRDFMKHIEPVTDEGRYLKKLYRESGFGDVVGYANLDDTVRGILGQRSVFGSTVDAGTIAFRAGEGIQRGVAWFAERRALINEVLDGKSTAFTKADIDTPAFVKAVSDRANNTALNMSKYNQPRFSRGLIGIPGQFLQFVTHQAELMMPGIGKLSGREKAGIWAAWVGAFGISGVPFAMDGVLLGETVAESMGHPEAVGAFERFVADVAESVGVDPAVVKKGAASGDAYDVTHRAALGYMLQSYYDGIQPEDLTGASGQVLYGTLTGTIKTIKDMYLVLSGDKKLTAEMAVQPFQEISGIYNPYAAVRAAMTGEVRDRKNRLIKTEPDLAEIVSMAVGIQPAEAVKLSEQKSLNIRINKAWKDWSRKKTHEIARVTIENPDFAAKLTKDAIDQIMQWNPTKARRFIQDLTWATLERQVPETVRSEMNKVRNKTQLPEE